MMVKSIVIGVLGIVSKGSGRVGNWRTNEDHPDYRIVEIGQTTKKSPRDQRRFVIQIPVKYQLTLV